MCVLFSAVRGNKLPAAFLHFELSFTRHKSHSVHVWRNRNMSVQSKHAVRLWERLQLEPGLVNSDVDRSLIGATWGRPAPFTHTHKPPQVLLQSDLQLSVMWDTFTSAARWKILTFTTSSNSSVPLQLYNYQQMKVIFSRRGFPASDSSPSETETESPVSGGSRRLFTLNTLKIYL